MGLFGKSFKDKVEDALEEVRGLGLAVENLDAQVDGKAVTLTGEAPTLEAKTRVMEEFNSRVKTDNTVNLVRVASHEEEAAGQAEYQAAEAGAQPAVAGSADEGERWYEVQPGDTLGRISQRYYGSASEYMRIFEANRDVLDNPDLIKVGQRLRIP